MQRIEASSLLWSSMLELIVITKDIIDYINVMTVTVLKIVVSIFKALLKSSIEQQWLENIYLIRHY